MISSSVWLALPAIATIDEPAIATEYENNALVQPSALPPAIEPNPAIEPPPTVEHRNNNSSLEAKKTALSQFTVNTLRPSVNHSPSEVVQPAQISQAQTTSSNETHYAQSPPEGVFVQAIEVVGNTVFSPEVLDEITEPEEGKLQTAENLLRIADDITQIYLNDNYITTRAIPGDFDAIGQDGIASINIIEGRVDDIVIEAEDSARLNESYIRSRVALGVDIPLNVQKLEDQLKLIRTDPLIRNIEAQIQPSGETGLSTLAVRVTENEAFESVFSVDNYSPPSVGSERLGIGLQHRNLTGAGDSLSASYFRTTTGGSQLLDVAYQIPLNPMEGTLQFRVAPSWTEVTSPDLASAGIEGENQLYSVNYRQPLIRTLREELALTLGFDYQNGQTFLFDDRPTPFTIGPDADGVSRTSVLRFGQEYVKRDTQGAWALRSQFNLGLGIFDATTNEGATPDGQFFSWQGQVQRVQQLNDDNLLIAQGRLQVTPDPLLTSQQFVIGGKQSLRGYRQNVRTGDNGFLFSVEDRIALARNDSGVPTVQLVPFVDMGMTWNTGNNPNPQLNQRFLSSIGLGLLLDDLVGVEGLDMQIHYGYPLIDLDDRGNNLQDEGLHFGLSYQP
ncbi:MAG: ShlB/FhaC/HecB family hemolysin secretion/activation protein [Cyanobacteria bacterium P01_A01_bin.116]